MKSLAEFLPLTHAVRISRAAFTGEYDAGLIKNVLVILVVEAIAFSIAIRTMKKRLIK
jgi:ABC-type polysaccharide/polyol phosphate export permease